MQALVYRFARGMQNFIYLIGDVETRQALVVDCCWDYEGIVKVHMGMDVNITMPVVVWCSQ
jgi:hypothetical protein